MRAVGHARSGILFPNVISSFGLSSTVSGGIESCGVELAAMCATACGIIAGSSGENAGTEALIGNIGAVLGSDDIVGEELGRGIITGVDGKTTR